MEKHIHPVFERYLQRPEKEAMLRQHGRVIWLTGLSGSGKTTIAQHLERLIASRGILTQVLDGDNLRTGISGDLGFSERDRAENIRRTAEVARLFLDCGIVVIACLVSPTRAAREAARGRIGEEDFIEVFVDTPIHECEARDVKGLYRKARAGEIPGFTGIHDPYEPPIDPAARILTRNRNVEACAAELFELVLPRILAT